MGVFFVFTRYLGFSAPLDILALFIAIIIAMMWNFLSNNWWTWKK
jgi:putative flippase GtrA